MSRSPWFPNITGKKSNTSSPWFTETYCMTNKVVKKTVGKVKKRGNKNDIDGDGVPNKKDCQPRNTMRQDKIAQDGMNNFFRNLEK